MNSLLWIAAQLFIVMQRYHRHLKPARTITDLAQELEYRPKLLMV